MKRLFSAFIIIIIVGLFLRQNNNTGLTQQSRRGEWLNGQVGYASREVGHIDRFTNSTTTTHSDAWD
jgi:hypothetical protein